VHRINGTRQTEVHTAEPLLPDNVTPFEFGVAVESLKSYTSPGNDHIISELIQTGYETSHPEIHNFFLYCSE